MSRVILVVSLVLVMSVIGCRDPENTPRQVYERLRQAVLEEDYETVFALMAPNHRRGHLNHARELREYTLTTTDEAFQARELQVLGLRDLEALRKLTVKEYAILRFRVGTGLRGGEMLRRVWVETTRVLEEKDDPAAGIENGVRMLGPDRAAVHVISERGVEKIYEFVTKGGRWFWRPDPSRHAPGTR